MLERSESRDFDGVVEGRKATVKTSCWRGAKVEHLTARRRGSNDNVSALKRNDLLCYLSLSVIPGFLRFPIQLL